MRGLDRNIRIYKDSFQQGTEGQNYAMKGVGPDSKEKAGHTYHRFDRQLLILRFVLAI